MNRRQKQPYLKVRNPAYRRAFQRLDESLEQNSGFSNAEKTELLGKHIFGDLWHEQEQADTVVLPK
jgi:tetrahydromethanopterin S-methyltransferase subunit G